MKWPLHAQPVSRSQIPLYNLYYLHSPGGQQNDPTIVWGTDVEVDDLQVYLRDRNQHAQVIVSRVHVLLQAVSRFGKVPGVQLPCHRPARVCLS